VRRPFLLIVALLLAAACGFALEAPRLIPRRLMLAVTRPQGSKFTPGDALMIARSLHQRLQDADGQLIVVETPERPAPATPESMGAAARDAGADSWMLLTLGGQWTSARLGIRAEDLLSNSLVADFSATRTTWTSPASLPGETWADAVEAVAGKFPMVESAVPPGADEQLARLTIKALPGSVVTGLGSAPIRIDSNGSAFRMLPAAREYSLRTSLPGYRIVTQKIFLSGDRELTVEQKKSSRWGLDVSLSDSRAPGMDFTMAIPTLSLFVRLGVTTYALALALSQTEVFLSDPLTNVELRAGIYLSPEDRFFRFYTGLGGFARIVHAKNTAPMFDPVAPLGFMLLIGTELPISALGRLYFEYTPSIYPTGMPDALRASLGPDNAPPGWLFASSAGFNLLSFRVGYRWPL
jgi:hypothetical protein